MQEEATNNSLKIYNGLYNNIQYRRIGELVAADLRANRESPRVSMVMNPITDTALMICGHPTYREAWLTLAVVCANSNLSISTINAIADYLAIYQQDYRDPRPTDFAASAKAMLKAYQSTDILRTAAICASDIHTWQARMAYSLFCAGEHLVTAANHLLKQDDLPYISEKIKKAIAQIINALYEGLYHSKEPRAFDFSEIRLPKAD